MIVSDYLTQSGFRLMINTDDHEPMHNQTKPRIKKLGLEMQSRRLVFDLSNRVTLIIPADVLQGLQNASAGDLTEVELWDEGLMIYWKNLDIAFKLLRSCPEFSAQSIGWQKSLQK